MNAIGACFMKLHVAMTDRANVAPNSDVKACTDNDTEDSLDPRGIGQIIQDPIVRTWISIESELLGLFIEHARSKNTAASPPETEGAASLPVPTEDAVQWASETIETRRALLAPFEGEKLEDGVRWLAAFVDALRTALARAKMVRVPHPSARSILDARLGRLADSARPRPVTKIPSDALADLRRFAARRRDPSGKTFTVAGPQLHYWELATSHGPPLLLPGTEAMPDDPAPMVRTHLTGGTLRAWIASWRLNAEWDEDHTDHAEMGLFELDVRHVLYNLYGYPRTKTVSCGKTYDRPPRSAEREFLEHIERLTLTYVHGIGEGKGKVVSSDPQRLVAWYEDVEGRRKIYRHAHIAQLAMRTQFMQFPIEALRLSPQDTPLALGVASLWRERIVSTVLRGAGHYRAKLSTLAEQLGEDWRAGSRHNGRAYWQTLVARIERVVCRGCLGTVHLNGEGMEAVVTLTPSQALAAAYRPLAEAMDSQRNRARAREEEARIRELLDRNKCNKRI